MIDNAQMVKDLFLTLSAKSKFPQLAIGDFNNACDKFGILHPRILPMSFLATHTGSAMSNAVEFEGKSVTRIKDKYLCRFEFVEILVRLAKVRYFDTKEEDCVSDALCTLLHDSIVINYKEEGWSDFRTAK